MTDMALKITIGRAMLFYLLDEMRLLKPIGLRHSYEARGLGLWLRNAKAAADELSKMNFDD